MRNLRQCFAGRHAGRERADVGGGGGGCESARATRAGRVISSSRARKFHFGEFVCVRSAANELASHTGALVATGRSEHGPAAGKDARDGPGQCRRVNCIVAFLLGGLSLRLRAAGSAHGDDTGAEHWPLLHWPASAALVSYPGRAAAAAAVLRFRRSRKNGPSSGARANSASGSESRIAISVSA